MSSTSTRIFEFKDDKSSKFWEVTQFGSTVIVRYGKTGTNGQTQEKVFDDASAASKHVAKLITEKTGKGYLEVGSAPSAGIEKSVPSDEGRATEGVAKPPTKTKALKLANAKPAKPKNPAQDPEASPESLLVLLDKDDKTNRLLARHPRASADLLEKLSHSSDTATRRGVAANPNTLPETYVKLGQQFPKEFLANPALDLLLMVNPALMEEVPEALLVRLLKQADCPASLLTWAADVSDTKVQLAVAMNVSAPESARQRLSQSFDPAVREAVKPMSEAASACDPEEAFIQALMQRIGSMSTYDLAEAWKAGDIGLAQWRTLPLIFRLAQVTNSEMFTPACVARLLRDSGRTMAEIQALLPDYPSWAEVASHPFMPESVLEALANDSKDSILCGVAFNPSTPVPLKVRVLEDLLSRSPYSNMYEVARNPATPVSVLEKLAKRSDNRLRCVVAKNPATSMSVLENLSKSSDESVRRAVAQNSSVPVSVLKTLSKDSKYTVRSAVANNPSAPVPLLEALSKDSKHEVRSAVARNPLTPAPLLKELSNDPNHFVRWSLTLNSCTPLSVQETLAKDVHSDLRRGVAGNPSTDPCVLEKLSEDRESLVKEMAISNPNTPLPALIKHVSAKAVGVRQALAAQSNRSPVILQSLWKDPHDSVRLAVASCPSLTQSQLDEMLYGCELETELATLLVHPNLSVKGVEFIFDKLFANTAADSAWYRRKLEEANADVKAAVQNDKLTYHHGKDPNKSVLAKRALAPLMALCAGPFIEPDRLVKVVGSTDWLVRAAVARNPGTPPNLIKKLSADAHPLVAALARTSLVPTPEVGTTSDNLDAEDLDLVRAVAEVLPRIRRVAADKPWTLFALVLDDAWGDQADAGDVMNALSSKVKIDRVLPQVCSKLGQEHQALMWEMGAKSIDPKVRQAVAQDPRCPVDVIKRLSEDDNVDVVLASLKNPVMPPENRSPIVQDLLKLRGSRLAQVACNSNAPPELLEAVATSRDEGIRSYAAQNPSTPVTMLDTLSKAANHELKQHVAANSSTPALVRQRVLDVLSKSAKAEFRISAAKNPFTTSPVLEALSKDPENLVRRAVAENPSAPVSLLKIFAEDSDTWIQKSVAANPTAPSNVLEALSMNSESLVRRSVAGNPSAPVSVLEALSKNSEWTVREIVARNPSTPPCVLEALSKHDRIKVFYNGVWREYHHPEHIQRAVAANPSTPLPVLDTLSRDLEDQVRLSVALNPSASVAALSCLAVDSNRHVAIAAAFNPSAPSTVLEEHIDIWVKRMARAIQREACNRLNKTPVPQTPITTDDMLRALEWLGYLNKGADNKVLTKASRSKDWLTRLGVALHPGASAGILKLLLQDIDEDVSGAARFRLQVTK